MKIFPMPIGDMNMGSSRIRCFRFLQFLPDDFEVVDSVDDCDVLYIQKAATKRHVDAAAKAKAKGIVVVYDLDDDIGVWPGMDEKSMCEIVDAIIVDSPERLKQVAAMTQTPVYVVPPGIDYMDERPAPVMRREDGSVVTFGNDHALRTAIPYMEPFTKKAQIGAHPCIPGVPLVGWKLDGFVDSLRGFDVCFLAHNEEDGQRRCPNRLITAMAAGVPCIATDTPSYRRVMEAAGFGDLLVSDPSDIMRCYEAAMKDRDGTAEKMMNYAWENHSPERSSQILAGVLDRIITVEQVLKDRDVSIHSYGWARELYDFVLERRPEKVVEFGVNRGMTTILMALALKRTGGKLVSYDMWEDEPDGGRKSGGARMGKVMSNLVRYGVNEVVELRKMDIREWLKAPGEFDLLYVDVDNDGDKITNMAAAVAEQVNGGSVVLFEGGTQERDQVKWMLEDERRPMCSVKGDVGYEVLDERRPGLSIIEKGDRKSMLVVIDEYGWAFEYFARGWAGYSRYDIEYARHDHVSQEDVDAADVVFVMSTVLQPHYSGNRLKYAKEKTICAIRSILAHEMVNPDRFAAVVTNSKRAYDFIKGYHPDATNLRYVLAAVDGNEFTFSGRFGKRVGWSGNPNHNVKRPHLLKRLAMDYGGVDFKCDWGKEFFNKGRSREDQILFLRGLRVFVQMSMSEGMSQALMEAVACGVPVVATNVGDTASLVPAEWLIQVEPEEESFRQAEEKIRRLMEEPGLAERVAEENRKIFEEGGWCWSSRAAEMDDMVDEVMSDEEDGEPDVTIVIPCYNHADKLERAVGSALAQEGAGVEVVIIDDGSPDNTKEVAERLISKDSRVRIVSHSGNKGLAAARNTGFDSATTEWVIPLDADDEIDPHFVEKCLGIEAKSGADVVYTDVVADKGGETEISFLPQDITRKNTIVCTALIRKALWKRMGGYDEEMRDGFEDWEFWIRAVKADAEFAKAAGYLFTYHNAGNTMLTLTNRKREDIMAYMRSKHPDLYAIPRATVVIPCFNSTDTLERAYASVAAQTEVNIDLVVVDDGSTDDIVMKFAVLRKEYSHLMARLMRMPKNKGLAAARNAGFNKAKAEWVIPLDADDEMEPDFVEKCLDASKRADVVYPNVVMIEGDQERAASVKFDADTITKRNTIVCTALIRKALWKKLKGYDEEMRGFEDWELWIRAVKVGARFVNADTSLRYYRSEGSMLDGDWQDEMRDYVASKHPDLFPPSVTVVIPVWNQAEYLERCVDSVMSQTVRAEVIVVDDGSPDNVKEVFEEIHQKYPGIRLVSQDNKGLPGARNTGFENAKAEWVIPLDADDRFASDDYIEKCLAAAGDGMGVVMTDGRSLSGRVTNSVVDLGRMRLENTMHACQMIRKSVWEDVGGYKLDFYKGYEDWEFWINCIEEGVEFGKCEGVHLEIDDEHGGRMTPEVQKAETYFELLGMIQGYHPNFFGKKEETKVRTGERIPGMSVVISSYNQLRTLKLALESLYFQEVPPIEVLVADDGSSDGTIEWLDMMADGKMPFELRYVTRKHSWYRLASINNLAAAKTMGSRVLFTNGDQVHCPTSIKSHMEMKDDEVGGGIFKGINVAHSGKVDISMVRSWGKVEELGLAYPSTKTNVGYMGIVDPNANPIGVWGGNFSVPGKVFDKIGGYDEGYDVGWGGEENDLVRRCTSEGCRVIWVKGSVIYHLDHPLRAYAYAQLGTKKYVTGS